MVVVLSDASMKVMAYLHMIIRYLYLRYHTSVIATSYEKLCDDFLIKQLLFKNSTYLEKYYVLLPSQAVSGSCSMQ